MATVCAPVVPAGVTQVMLVELTTFTEVQLFPPTVMLAPVVNCVPVIVIVVLPACGPKAGAMLVIVNGLYENPLLRVPDWVSALVTIIEYTPCVFAGVTQVMLVVLTTTTLLQATPPIVRVAPEIKPVPAIVTEVPPVINPLLGEIEVIVGNAL